MYNLKMAIIKGRNM